MRYYSYLCMLFSANKTFLLFHTIFYQSEREITSGKRQKITLGMSDAEIQPTTVSGTNNIVLKTSLLSLEQSESLTNVLTEKFGVEKNDIQSQGISSTISGEMRRDAIIAVIVACIFMLIYIRFRFKDIRFATSAIIAYTSINEVFICFIRVLPSPPL